MRFLIDLFTTWLKQLIPAKTRTPKTLPYKWDFTDISLELDASGEPELVSGIIIDGGSYDGVIFYYTSVKVLEDAEKGAKISFTYNVHSSPTGIELHSDPEFRTMVISILDQILKDQSGIEAVSAADHLLSAEKSLDV